MTYFPTTLDQTHCPWCGHEIDRALSETMQTPKSGDCSICWGCGEWSVFREDLTLRFPTRTEFIDIAGDADAQRVREQWLRIIPASKRKAIVN